VVGYLASVSVVQQISWGFYQYVQNHFWLPYGWLPLSLLLLMAAILVFAASIRAADAATSQRLQTVDTPTLAIITLSFVLLSFSIDRQGGLSFYWSPVLMLFTMVTYLAFMLTFAALVLQLRDRHLRTSAYVIQYLRVFPMNSLPGALMAAVVIGNLALLLIFNPGLSNRVDQSIMLQLLSAITVLAMSLFCSHTLSLEEQYERAHVDKIQAERFKTELITNVSHDIRTPLTSIINYIGLIKALSIEDATLNEYVEVLDNKSNRLKVLIDDLMEASKASTGNISVNLEEIDLTEIVGQIAGEFDERLEERSLTLVLNQPEHHIVVHADSRHLWRVLENLFGNIVKYALPGTRVFAEITLHDSSLLSSSTAALCPVLILRNTSETPLELSGDALTDQFIQGDRSRQTEGSGLGLYIAKSLMDMMEGSLTVRTYGDLFEVVLAFNRWRA